MTDIKRRPASCFTKSFLWAFAPKIGNFQDAQVPPEKGCLALLQERLLVSLKYVGDGPNTVSESTVSNTELSEIFGPHRVPGRELSELLSAYYLCAKVNSLSFLFAKLTEFAPKLSEATPTCARTLVPVFEGTFSNSMVPSFRFSFQGNIRQNHPFGKPPFLSTAEKLLHAHHLAKPLCFRVSGFRGLLVSNRN